jgi:CheY-like chemotaxis protein
LAAIAHDCSSSNHFAKIASTWKVKRKIMNGPARFRILYVASIYEDSLLLQVAIGTGRVEVIFVETAAEALEELKRSQFDVCLLETRLPDANGFDLCKQIRKLGYELPVVFYSGDVGEIYRSMGFAAGADAYLAKPYFESLMDKIGEYMHLNPGRKAVPFSDGVLDECRLMERAPF